ncbi:type II toxin-antitoxin system HicA family toxin [Candidatus Poriferisodalis sp.]|uniref:type II toxin-antitoxin system HicA family toxin n=1 Tax=Candidatus Poriferisodalis sp. TaxID=3101277 RepID=UPI003B58B5ED
MSQHLGPASRRQLIRWLRDRGWDGPVSEANHAHMIRGSRHVVLPTQSEIGSGLLLRILKQAGYTRADWLSR